MPEKKLKPTLRENKRYLLLDGEFDKKNIESAVLNFLGNFGYAKSGLIFVKKNIIAVNRQEVDKVRAALTLSEKLISVKKVSGSIKNLRGS